MKNRSIFTALVLMVAFFGFFTACEDEDLNEPDSSSYTVSFEANGGNPAPESQTVSQGGKVTEPAAMTKNGYGFGGWYKEAALTNQWNFNNAAVTRNTILYAKWTSSIVVSGSNWNAKMRWLDTNIQNGGAYIIELDSDESTGPITLSYNGKKNISITLKGIGSMRTLSLNATGSMFTVESGVTLILGDNLELRGWSGSYSGSLIRVNSGGNLILNHGARITGNTNSSSSQSLAHGGGVYVDGGTFTMRDGEISGNTSGGGGGGGVSVIGGTFTMSGGKISGNTAFSLYGGGGVYVAGGGTFTMSGGEISGNTASYYSTSYSHGGGVSVIGGTFTMSGGKISGNTTSTYDNGRYSTTSTYGGGVYMNGNGIFTMHGGEISGNTSAIGGGVFVEGGTFNKTGGTIFGYPDGGSNSNTVKDGSGTVQSNLGHAVYVYHSNNIYRMVKDTTSGPANNLSFNGTVTPPTYGGEWDN